MVYYEDFEKYFCLECPDKHCVLFTMFVKDMIKDPRDCPFSKATTSWRKYRSAKLKNNVPKPD